MKRIILMLTVAAMMVVAITVTAAPGFAGSLQQECHGEVINLGGGDKKCPDTYSNPGTDNENAATPKRDTLSSGPGAGGGKDDDKFDRESKVVGCGKDNTNC